MRTLLVDDHALFLEGLRNLLAANGFEIVGAARNGAEALLQFEMLKPDLVLMDLQMPGCDGIQTTQAIIKDDPEAKIVMLTAIEDEESLFAAIQAGAAGYLLKNMEPEHFIRQLAGLAAGETPLAPGFSGLLLREFSRRGQPENTAAGGAQRELTERQAKLLSFLTEGLTYKEIAGRMGVKEVTVKYHVKEILAKLHMDNRAQLIVHAARQGLPKAEADNK
ncbi:MAG: response regulator transcription factor [Negativicutes bacterium]|nr:response regulator transcription factor [Negativicutes bacterium]